MKKNKQMKLFTLINTLIMFSVCVLCIYPFLHTLAISLSGRNAIMSGKVFLFPKEMNGLAYMRSFVQPNFIRSFYNSFVYTLTGTGLSLFMTLICGYALSRKTLPGKRFILVLVIGTMFFPAGMIPSFLIMSRLHMIDTIWSQIIPNAIMPYLLFMMIAFMKQIPNEIEEAGMIDGMNPIQSLVYIIVPLSKPIIATVTLFTALMQWNNWFSAMIYLNTANKFPVMLILKSIIEAGDMALKGQGTTDVELMVLPTSIKSASVMLVSIPIIVLYVLLQKHFIKGLMIGAVKG